MELRELTEKEVRAICRKTMREDFPRSERKPYRIIRRAMRNGVYICYALCDGQTLLGYAFFVRQEQTYLLDYLATAQQRRNQGLGAQFLSLLRQRLSDAQCIFAEVEEPLCAETEEQRQLRSRRLQFYLRNGFVDTTARASAFGVQFRLIELEKGEKTAPERILQLYRQHYRAVLPERVFRKAIRA